MAALCGDKDELRAVCEQIGAKAATKFKTVREAFRFLRADHAGRVARCDLHYFFRAYDVPEKVADRCLDHFDTFHTGLIDLKEFVQHMTPYIRGARPPLCLARAGSSCSAGSGGASTRSPTPTPTLSDQALDEEFAEEMRRIKAKATQKFLHARDVFVHVDGGNEGRVTKSDMRNFFCIFGLQEGAADRFYDRLDEDDVGVVEYRRFVRVMARHLDLPGAQALMQQGSPTSERSRSKKSRSSSKRSSSKVSATTTENPGSSSGAEDEPRRIALERELRQLLQDIEEKSHFKFRHVRDAFRSLDLSRDGKISRNEMRCWLRGFGWPEATADRLFDLLLLDEGGVGELDFSDFMAHFEAILGPANRPAPRTRAVAVADPALEREVNELAKIITERLLTKYKSIREAFGTLNLSNTGEVTQSEMRLFFRSLNLPEESAVRFFRLLARGGGDTVAFDDVLALFGSPSGCRGKWQTIDDFRHVPRPTMIQALR